MALWSPIFSAVIDDDTFSKGSEELPDFLSNVLHESALLTRMEENLNYSAQGLLMTFPTRVTSEQALELARRPEAIANQVYGARHGNSQPGDGWRYRGRSPIQLTFFDNYSFVGGLMGQDLTTLPELVAQPTFGLEATIHWWEDRVPDSKIGNAGLVRRVVNGGDNGLHEVQALRRQAAIALEGL